MTPRQGGVLTLADGAKISWAAEGPQGGLPLLLLRPLGASMSLWGRFRSQLATRARVISFDWRGVGASTAPGLPHSTAGLATDALQLLSLLDVPRAHVFGLSLGGMVATRLAAAAPARVGRLILASTPVNGTDLSRATILRGSSFVRCFTLPRREVGVALAGKLLSPRFRREEPEAVDRFIAAVEAQPTSRATLLALLTAAALHRGGSDLSRIRAETLVLFGSDDELLLRRAQGELMERLRHATFDLIEDAGHDLSIEQPDRLARRVLEFLAAP